MAEDRLRKRRNAQRRERYRLNKLLELERTLWAEGRELVAGIDEVGRGPLAGPVVAAAVVFPPGFHGVDRVKDSKQLTAKVRLQLARKIRERAACWGVGAASVAEIDRLNILRASQLAMRRAIGALRQTPDHLIVDGLRVAELGEPQTAVVGGDAHVHCVACASVLAKVVRDDLMERLARRYPQYGWDQNAGYGTAEHRAAILRWGPSPHHRMSFTSLQFTLDFGAPAPLDEPPLA